LVKTLVALSPAKPSSLAPAVSNYNEVTQQRFGGEPGNYMAENIRKVMILAPTSS
jgi:hypothetical protein